MNSIIHKLISWLEKKNIIEPAEYHLYAYAVKSLFITIFPLLLSVIIGLFFSDIKSSLIIIIPYSLLRKFTGGYHTKSFYTCMLLSCGLIILVNLLSIANYYPLFNLFLCLYFLVYYYFTPVESSKRVLDVYEITTFRKISIYIYIIFFVFYTLLLFLKAYHFATCIFWGITLNVVLIIPCILTKHID